MSDNFNALTTEQYQTMTMALEPETSGRWMVGQQSPTQSHVISISL
jgi:hypothetical protein